MTNSAHSHRNPSSLDNWTATTLVVSALVSLAVLTAACSDQSAAPTPTIELAPTSTPVTTEAPTSEVPTTTQAPPTTEDPRIAEIEAAVAASRDLQVELLKDPSIPVERMEEVVTGSVLETVVASILMARADGLAVEGMYLGRPLETILDSETEATHLECGLDAVGSTDREGNVVTAPDESPYLVRYELVRSGNGDRWLVGLVRLDGPERTPCEL